MSAGLEVADVFRRHGEAYRRAHAPHLGRVERRVMSAIELCRTAALGGHTEACSECGLVRCAYNSCRNRHCPKCQGQARAEWLAARQAEAGQFADHGVAADTDIGGNLAAGEAGLKMVLQKFDAFGGPGR